MTVCVTAALGAKTRCINIDLMMKHECILHVFDVFAAHSSFCLIRMIFCEAWIYRSDVISRVYASDV